MKSWSQIWDYRLAMGIQNPNAQESLVKVITEVVRLDMRLDALEKRMTAMEDRNVNNRQEYAELQKRRGETPRKE